MYPLVFLGQDNAVLYCIGDLNVDETEDQIRQMFGHLGGVPDTTVRELTYTQMTARNGTETAQNENTTNIKTLIVLALFVGFEFFQRCM